jgi:hypothetical protein
LAVTSLIFGENYSIALRSGAAAAAACSARPGAGIHPAEVGAFGYNLKDFP